MHHADRPIALPAMFAGMSVFVREPQAHPRVHSRDERLAIEAGAFAETEIRPGARQAGPTPAIARPRPQPVRDPIRS